MACGVTRSSEMREVVRAAAADAGAVVGGRVSELLVRLLGEESQNVFKTIRS